MCVICKSCLLLVLVLFNSGLADNLPFVFRSHNHSGVPVKSWFLKANFVSDGHAQVSPCTNFYAYACTSWLSRAQKPPYEPTWNPWIATAHQIRRRLSKMLTHHDPTLLKPQIFYHACLQTVNHERKYLQELVSLVQKLGGWPLVDKTWTPVNYDWLDQLSQITRSLGVHPILKIHADLDYKDPQSVLIYIEPGNLIFPSFILTGREHGAELEAYEKWILETASHLFNLTDVNTNEIKEIIKFEINLAKMAEEKSKSERMTVGNLSKKFSRDWSKILTNIFGGFFEINLNTTVAVKNYQFLKNFFILIDRVGEKTIANYLIWNVIKDLSRDTTNHMKNLNFLIDQAILGVASDLTPEYECIDKIIKYFSPLLVPRYLKIYTNPKIFAKINSLFDSIKTEFIQNLENNKWLTKDAKILTSEKVKSIKLHLGYSSEILEKSHLNYKKVLINGDHFANILKLKIFKTTQTLSLLMGKNVTTLWPSTPFEVNAYYSVLQNSIFIPLALLQPPFFHNIGEEASNYGSLGFLIAHEISHSLDPTGILADPTGKIRSWLPKRDLQIYKKRIRCFGDDNTIGEKIADINGLKISLEALKKRTSNIINFFISFAQMWCETSDTDIFAEEHSPNLRRVQSLQNFDEFSETFGCDSGTVCDLW